MAPAARDGAAKDKTPKPRPVHAVVAGTVFRADGMSLPGAQVELSAGETQKPTKFKKMQQVADARGEFAFHVPAGESQYKVSVRAAGYQGDAKQVTIQADERVDVFFRLEPASNASR